MWAADPLSVQSSINILNLTSTRFSFPPSSCSSLFYCKQSKLDSENQHSIRSYLHGVDDQISWEALDLQRRVRKFIKTPTRLPVPMSGSTGYCALAESIRWTAAGPRQANRSSSRLQQNITLHCGCGHTQKFS